MRICAIAMALIATSCATAPISYLSAVPESATEDTYSCTLRTMNELEFTIVNTDREAGFITGERQTSGLGTAILVGRNYFDQLTVSIFPDGDGGRTIRVTAGSTNESSFNFGSASRTAQAPQDSAKDAANELLTTCGSGEVRIQGQDPATADGEADDA